MTIALLAPNELTLDRKPLLLTDLGQLETWQRRGYRVCSSATWLIMCGIHSRLL